MGQVGDYGVGGRDVGLRPQYRYRPDQIGTVGTYGSGIMVIELREFNDKKKKKKKKKKNTTDKMHFYYNWPKHGNLMKYLVTCSVL